MHLTLFAVFKTLFRTKEIEIKHWSLVLVLQRSASGPRSGIISFCRKLQKLIPRALLPVPRVVNMSQRFTFFESID